MDRNCLLFLFLAASAWAQTLATSPRQPSPASRNAPGQEPPREWLDASTHHRIVRLSDEEGSASLYFHQNAYTAKGDLLLITTREGLAVIDLETRKVRRLVRSEERRVGKECLTQCRSRWSP